MGNFGVPRKPERFVFSLGDYVPSYRNGYQNEKMLGLKRSQIEDRILGKLNVTYEGSESPVGGKTLQMLVDEVGLSPVTIKRVLRKHRERLVVVRRSNWTPLSYGEEDVFWRKIEKKK